MAALQSLRNKAGVAITILIAIALLSFILTDLLGQNSIFSSTDEIGEIDGEAVKVQEYQQRVDELESFTKMNQGTMSLTEETQNQIREQVWRQMIQEKAFGKVYENAGIEVTADELVDMAIGNHISPALRPLFTNPQTNAYDRQIAENFLRNKNQDPQAAFYWQFVEKSLKQDRLANKYMSLLKKSLYCTGAQAKVDAGKRSNEVDLAFVGVRYNTIPDSTIKVTDSEINARYKKNKELYKVDATRDIEYVSFPIKPTDLDREETMKAVADLKADFAAAETDAFRFAQMNSENPTPQRYVSKAQLAPAVAAFVETAKVGDVTDPYREGDSYKISRLVEVVQRPDSVKARHILIRDNEQLADSLFEVLKKGANFADAARKYSEDPGSAINGGDLDWFNDGVMVPEFNEACFNNAKGSIVKIQSNYGVHIINVQDKGVATTKYSVATIDKSIQFSSRTQQEVYAQANAFASQVKDQASFEAQVDSANLVKRYGNGIRSNAHSINSLRSAREIVKWIYKADVGEVSEIFEANDEFIIAVLVREQEKGYAKVEDVKQSITRELLNEKKVASVASAAAGKSLSDIAAMYNAKVDSAHHVSLASNVVSGAGNEPALVGKAVATDKGARIDALQGNNAVYFAEVTNVETKEADEETARVAYMQQFQSLEYIVTNYISDVEVEDNRIKFY
ncbi:MAG: SurA N-terminal domain-containing protein [Bacteroidales bacterium]|nr:SurA N-terminal domain-containing protein [Bacteroidales bacterium]